MSSSATDTLPAWAREPGVTLPLSGLLPEAGEEGRFATVEMVPGAGLGSAYSVMLPAGWTSHVGRSEGGPLSDTVFATLGVFSPGPGDQVFPLVGFGVVRAPRAGTVKAFFEAYCAADGLEIVAQRTVGLLVGGAVEGFVVKRTAIGVLATRLVLFEGGRCLYALSGTARLEDYRAAARTIGLALCSFELRWPGVQRMPLE